MRARCSCSQLGPLPRYAPQVSRLLRSAGRTLERAGSEWRGAMSELRRRLDQLKGCLEDAGEANSDPQVL